MAKKATTAKKAAPRRTAKAHVHLASPAEETAMRKGDLDKPSSDTPGAKTMREKYGDPNADSAEIAAKRSAFGY